MTILITGASSGNGEQTARALAAGHIVDAGARRFGRLNASVEAGARAPVPDLSGDKSMTPAVRTIDRSLGRSNAGSGSHGALEDVPNEKMHETVQQAISGRSDREVKTPGFSL